VSHAPDISPTAGSGGVDAGGGCTGGAIRWAITRGIDAGDNDRGVRLARANVDANGQQCCPCQGHDRSGEEVATGV
jgi:hypothetical protein